ncbi:MAG: flavodoxin family protein [Alteromonadaceae bacterium]|nr:flavodoxin family protein [Alteromonadaceae bacterium]
MANILLILGKETSDFAKGEYNASLFQTALEHLREQGHACKTTVVEEGYNPEEEIEKFKWADSIIFQYPVYWFMMPSSLKKYIDSVYAYGAFFGHGDGAYGSGGLMKGKQFMLSTTWNAPADAFGDEAGFFEGASATDALAPMRNTQRFCGMDELAHFFAHDIIHKPNFEYHKAQFVQHLKAVFEQDVKLAV